MNWIKTSERLPNNEQKCLIWYQNEAHKAKWSAKYNIFNLQDGLPAKVVTHWMPLPSAPSHHTPSNGGETKHPVDKARQEANERIQQAKSFVPSPVEGPIEGESAIILPSQEEVDKVTESHEKEIRGSESSFEMGAYWAIERIKELNNQTKQ